MTRTGYGYPSAPAPAPRKGDLQLFFNAAGRVGRVTYVAGMAPAVILLRVPAIFAPGWGQGVAIWLCWPVALVVACTLTSKRLHDTGLAGWWTALLLGLILVTLWAPPGETILGSACGWILVVALALLVAWPGDPDFNRFGPVADRR